MLEWDERKRLQILRDRDLDFRDTAQMFDGRPSITMRSFRNDEDRFVSVAVVEDRLYTVVWMWRGENRRIISFRRASDAEERQYRALHG
jgi:uncharacterized protein